MEDVFSLPHVRWNINAVWKFVQDAPRVPSWNHSNSISNDTLTKLSWGLNPVIYKRPLSQWRKILDQELMEKKVQEKRMLWAWCAFINPEAFDFRHRWISRYRCQSAHSSLPVNIRVSLAERLPELKRSPQDASDVVFEALVLLVIVQVKNGVMSLTWRCVCFQSCDHTRFSNLVRSTVIHIHSGQ